MFRVADFRTQIARWTFRHTWGHRVVRSLGIALGTYGAAWVAFEIDRTQHLNGLAQVGFQAVAILIITVVVAMLFQLFVLPPDARLQNRAKVFVTAHSRVDACLAEQLNNFDASCDRSDSLVPVDPQRGIQSLVSGLYTCIDSHYSSSDIPGERTNFEVTFMTKAYEDGAITITAWASRDGRAPKSLTEQEQRRNIYDSTETAALYREAETQQPRPRIISDTGQHQDYSELYPGQKDRIRSSIVYPVLSAQNSLLGTIVLHCDSAGFFSSTDEKYWWQLLEIFTSRIALHKTRLDHIASSSGR